MDVQEMAVEGITFKTTQDHSKWAITIDSKIKDHSKLTSNKKTICVCDMNRQASQAKRGGGCICMEKSTRPWSQFAEIVTKAGYC